MITNYKKLDKIHAMNNPDDCANRGVTLLGWILAFVFSGAAWLAIYFLLK